MSTNQDYHSRIHQTYKFENAEDENRIARSIGCVVIPFAIILLVVALVLLPKVF